MTAPGGLPRHQLTMTVLMTPDTTVPRDHTVPGHVEVRGGQLTESPAPEV